MAEFLTRHGIVHYLNKIIEEADSELVLISPYIKADDETKAILKDKKRSTQIHVIYGKKELSASERAFLDALGIKTVFLQNLHAKCYLNENEALLTSMNLYQFSQEHNDEMGILVSKVDDAEIYGAIYRQAKRWLSSADEVESAEPRKAKSTSATAPPRSRPAVAIPEEGFCIRGKEVIPFNPSRPYCDRHYAIWKRYEDSDYEEKHCHLCGKDVKSTMSKPVGLECCYRKYRSALAKLQQ